MRIEFKGAEKLMAKLKTVASRYPQERDRFLRSIGQKVKDGAMMRTPVDTGFLRESWSMTEPSAGSVEIGNPVEYAQYVEFPCRQFVYGRDTGRIRAGSFMLRDSLDDVAENFETEATRILARLFN